MIYKTYIILAAGSITRYIIIYVGILQVKQNTLDTMQWNHSVFKLIV